MNKLFRCCSSLTNNLVLRTRISSNRKQLRILLHETPKRLISSSTSPILKDEKDEKDEKPLNKTDPAMASQETKNMSQASIYDSLRVFQSVIVPTLAKGVIKRRPWVEAIAQHLGLDTNAVQLLQELRKKYGPSPLLLWLPFRSQVVILDPKDASQVLFRTPIPFTSATKEKKSSLEHFEPNHILIAGPERRAQLRPVHENVLATKDRTHPLMERFQTVINEELDSLLPPTSTEPETTLDFPTFSEAWFRIIRRITLGDAARNDNDLTTTLDAIRLRGNWGFMAPANDSKLAAVRAQLAHYIKTAEPGSLASLLPQDPSSNLDLVSQITHYLFGFDAAAIATFRALALLGSHPAAQAKARDEAKTADNNNNNTPDRPFARAVFLESLRLWPTTPAILRELDQDAAIGGNGDGGHVFAKGTGVVVFTPLFHRDTEKLEFADRLEPGQWIGDQGKADVDLVKGLVPFSAGPAMCPAHNLVPMVCGLVMGGVLGRGEGMELVKPGLEPGRLPGTLDHAEVEVRVRRRVGGSE